VLDYFASQNVNPLRLDGYGRGETEPRADNSTEAGRQLNRRVELLIVPVLAKGKPYDPSAFRAVAAT